MASNFKIQNFPSLSLQVSQFSLKPMFLTFNFISRSTILPQIRASIPFYRLHCLSLSSSPSPFSSNEHPFEVSYLMNKFGWPPEFAISKTKYVKFETPEKPERVLGFFKKHGFNETQISIMVKKLPRLLIFDPENNLLPKLKFLRSLGLSTTEITDFVTKHPYVLERSLENAVKPAFKLLRSLVDSDGEAVKMVKQYPIILTRNIENENSVQILLEAGVPRANIAASMTIVRKGRTLSPDGLRRLVEELKEMGFDPCNMKFIHALHSIKGLSESECVDKVQVLKKYGWSDRHIFSALEKFPRFIGMSEDKIERVMDFLVKEMGIEGTDVARYPSIIGKSLEKTIVPRCLVYQSAVEKGLAKRNLSIISLCSITKDKFVTRIIKRYENEAPELWDLYWKLLNF